MHVSPAWADVRERTEQFHQDLAEAALEDDGPGPDGQRFDAFLTNFARSFDCCTRVGSWTYIMCPAG